MLDRDFTDRMRVVLTQSRRDILKHLMTENQDFQEAVENLRVKDLGDVASADIDCRVLEAIGTRDTVRLSRVEAALARLENGKYGICARCSSAIPPDRLQAVPHAVLCLDCKSATEKNSKK